MLSWKKLALVLLTLLACTSCKNSQTSFGRIDDCGDDELAGIGYRVLDGDTIKLKSPTGVITTVRLDQIDAPEKSQPWGNRSKQLLFGLVGNKALCISGKKHDRYGRLIGEVHTAQTDVNREMIRLGGAWAYRTYLRDQSLLELENEAHAAKRGLWKMPPAETVPPWEFRKARRSGKTTGLVPLPQLEVNPNSILSSPDICNARPSCRQMTSCLEARSWLARCGSEGLDGDGDGVPCERICGHDK